MLGMLNVKHYLTSPGDVQKADEYVSQEFTGQVWSRYINLECVCGV